MSKFSKSSLSHQQNYWMDYDCERYAGICHLMAERNGLRLSMGMSSPSPTSVHIFALSTKLSGSGSIVCTAPHLTCITSAWCRKRSARRLLLRMIGSQIAKINKDSCSTIHQDWVYITLCTCMCAWARGYLHVDGNISLWEASDFSQDSIHLDWIAGVNIKYAFLVYTDKYGGNKGSNSEWIQIQLNASLTVVTLSNEFYKILLQYILWSVFQSHLANTKMIWPMQIHADDIKWTEK